MAFCFKKENNLKPILMLDLDEAPVDTELKKLDDRIKTKKTVNIDIKRSLIHSTGINYLYRNEVKIKETGKRLGKFYLVLFACSLEKAAGIIPSDEAPNIEDKISKLVEMQDIKSTFSQIF